MLTVDLIRQQLLEAKALIREPLPALSGKRAEWIILDDVPGTLLGMNVHVSPLCERWVPVRDHRGKGATVYSKRIQKKWLKRYGMKKVQDVFIANGARDVFMHPEAFAKLRIELDKGIKHL